MIWKLWGWFKRHERAKYVHCQYCNDAIIADNMARHIKEEHAPIVVTPKGAEVILTKEMIMKARLEAMANSSKQADR